MTLKEKFGEYAKQEVWEKRNHNAEECEKIAEEFAIGFAMHISTHCYCELGNDTRSYKELLQIYKKEKGL